MIKGSFLINLLPFFLFLNSIEIIVKNCRINILFFDSYFLNPFIGKSESTIVIIFILFFKLWIAFKKPPRKSIMKRIRSKLIVKINFLFVYIMKKNYNKLIYLDFIVLFI